MADSLTQTDLTRSLDLLRGGAANADGQSSLALLDDVRAKVAGAGHGDLADTLGKLRAALADGAEGATIGGHMATAGQQVEAIATREAGSGAELRELAELLKGEGSRISG
jgi:hypothetical protein